MSEEHIPPVPPECDLRGLPWMPVDTERLLNSDLWALSTPEEFKVALRLWCKAWQQRPAASLPDDDRILAELSGAGRRWKKLRPMALRGFVKCTDGRLYHPVLAEKAAEAWAHRQAQRDRASKRWHKPGIAAAHAAAYPEAMQGTGTIQGQDTTGTSASLSSLRSETSADQTISAGGARRPSNGNGVTVPIWQAFSSAYQSRYGVEPVRNAKVNGMLASFAGRVPHAEAPEIAAFYVMHNRQDYVRSKHDVSFLLRDAEGLRTEWATGRRVTDTEARRADRSSATVDQVNRMLAEAGRQKIA